MKALRIIAGKTAKKRIIDNGGLTPDMVRMVLGASGGPKWLILRGLDDLIFGDWLLNSSRPIDLLGTSIGAWRMTLAATANPRKAFNLFEELYFGQQYDADGNRDLWTDDSYALARELIADGRSAEIVSNQQRRLNIISVRAKGIAGMRGAPYMNILGMIKAAALNFISRDTLDWAFDRALFSVNQSDLPLGPLDSFNRFDVPITEENLADVMMASGSIPGFWHEIADIEGAPKGAYRDGGVTDYHFGQDWDLKEGVILYPHFYSHMTPGWFDKAFKSRHAKGDSWNDTVMLCPTDDLVASLPYGKITGRTDFKDYSNEERLAIWAKVVQAGYQMADDFNDLMNASGAFVDRVEDAPS